MKTSSSNDLESLADFVVNMIIQHDYPGFEPRSFRIGLTEEQMKSSSKLFAEALGHESVYVRLAALRWFQEKAGAIKPHIKAILGLLKHDDEWVRMEVVVTLERYHHPSAEIAQAIVPMLDDEFPLVRREAAKALGKILHKLAENSKGPQSEEILAVVRKLKAVMVEDKDAQVRQKAEKALRKSGAYSG
jgi:HEAT repeat protein